MIGLPPYYFAVALVIAALVLRYFLQRRSHFLTRLPGPPPGSWMVGNLPSLFRPVAVGDADFSWIKAFGTSMRIKGTFGRDILFTADPKALQYMLNTSAYNFPKPPENRLRLASFTGRGLIWAEGAQHSRHRRIMSPAFSYGSLRGFLPLFQQTSQKTVAKWKELVMQSEKPSMVVEITEWLGRTTLDALGASAFDYQFGALDDEDSELAKVYKNLLVDAIFNRSDRVLTLEDNLGRMPKWLIRVLRMKSTKQAIRVRDYMKVSRDVAQSLVNRQMESHTDGKDIMSVLVKANLSENPKHNLKEDELLSQLTTLLLAGHDTTATTLAWALHELSRRPDCQNEVRKEIIATRDQATQRGDSDLTVADLDSMKYLVAFMKETLRHHPIIPQLARLADRDDSIPLASTQRTTTGETITEIPVRKGQRIMISLAAYNRLESVWGPDANAWRPERFLEGTEGDQKTNLGVIANLATFSSGVRSCIGWRFALIEMQTMLIEFIENFEISPPPGDIEIIRAEAGNMTPMVKGSKLGRAELPLMITPLT